MYEYRVKEVIRVVDGDTVDVVLDTGFGHSVKIRLRVASFGGVYVDTPERTDKVAWETATKFTQDWMAAHMYGAGVLVCSTQKAGPSSTGIGDGAFGRWLGDFQLGNEPTLAQALIEQGYVRD